MGQAVKLNLKKHCIQTASKRYLDKLMKRAMETEELNEELEQEINMLQLFLDSEDFAYLRSSDERLAGGMDVNVVVFVEDGKVKMKIE